MLQGAYSGSIFFSTASAPAPTVHLSCPSNFIDTDKSEIRLQPFLGSPTGVHSENGFPQSHETVQSLKTSDVGRIGGLSDAQYLISQTQLWPGWDLAS